ncbi:MAG: phosphotransferase [Terracidiphilus sp.]|nr:phosphotransferase [Terracidiphilus sp.]
MNTTAQVHGMDGELIPSDWPPLTLPELRPLVAEFPACGEPLRILTVSPRPFSSASVVETTAGRIFVKRHARLVRNAEGLIEEHRFMAHLLAHDTQVPQVYATRNGATALERGVWTYEIHSIPTGADLYRETLSWLPFFNPAHARSAGAMMARLHLAADGFDAPARPVRPLVSSFSIFATADPTTELNRYLSARPALDTHAAVRRCANEAFDLLAPFHAELHPLLPSLPALWTHNDLHASNFFWSDESPSAEASAIIDFGLADRTFAVFDIAQAIERGLIGWLSIVSPRAPLDSAEIHFDQIAALLDGYESIRPLSRTEAAALAPTLALCHAEFALTESDYFLGILHAEDKAPYAYDSYLIGHARWFRTAGQKLLDFLRRWADRHTEAAQ